MEVIKGMDMPNAVRLPARIDGLDGLRGIALLMVILAHVHLLNFGWVGMQSFFVLSGFLITRILLKDKKVSTSFKSFLGMFYMRRVLRVFPLYYSYLTVIAIGALLLGLMAAVSPHLLPAYTYTYNYFHLGADYPHSHFFSHLWSMAVEEQFYLIWPLVIYLVPRRNLKSTLILLILAGPLLRLATWWIWPPDIGVPLTSKVTLAVYLLTPSHMDAFAAGALVNLVNWRVRYSHVLILLALLFAVGVATNGIGIKATHATGSVLSLGWPVMMPKSMQFIWGYSAINLFWLATILAIINADNGSGPFRWQVFDWLGKRSYSSYIVHYPILFAMLPLWDFCNDFTGNRISGALLLLTIYLPITLFIADLTYRYIELPTLAFKNHFSTHPST